MSGHEHEHGGNCHCKECEDKKADTERTSIEEAGGVAVGFTGHIHGYNADVAARFSKVMLTTGKWVEKEAGSLLGHIKAAIYTSDGKGFTLNLTNIKNGVEQHGTLLPQERVEFNFMSAVLDVDAHELEHVMLDALEDSGIDFHLGENCHHDHEHEGHDHHDHHHDHDHEGHDHHHHDHDHECHDHGHDHDHHSHQHNDKDEVCHCQSCEDRRKKESEKAEKGSFWDRFRRSKK